MPVVKDTVVQVGRTTNGTQTFTGSLGGATPTAAKFYVYRLTALNTKTDHNNGSVGFTDGTTHGYNAWTSEDGQANADTGIRSFGGVVLTITAPGDEATVEIAATFSSFSADAVTINYTTTNGTAYYVVCVLYAGVSANMGVFAPSGTINTDTVVSGLGFTPRFIEFFGNSLNAASAANTLKVCMGAACLYNSVIEQGSHYQFDDHADATSDVRSNTKNDRVFTRLTNGGVESYALEITDISSGEFTATTRDAAGTTGNRIFYLALGTDEDEVNIIDASIAASTGNQSFTGMGFQPDFVTMLGGMVTSFGTQEFGADADGLCVNIFTDSYNFTGEWTSQDGVTTTNTFNRLQNDLAVRYVDGADTVLLAATGSMAADGVDLNFSVAGQACVYILIGFKDPSPPSGGFMPIRTRMHSAILAR